MIEYYNIEEKLKKESIPVEIRGARSEGCSLLSFPATSKESKIEMAKFLKDRQFILKTLDPKRAEILTMYYGLNGETPLSISQIAEKRNVTATAIGADIRKSLRLLMYPSRISLLMLFTDQDIINDLENIDELDMDKLEVLQRQKIARIQQERYNALSEQEKEACDILYGTLLHMKIKDFLKALNITDEETKKINNLIIENLFSYDSIVSTLLKLNKKELKENSLQEVVDAVTSIGLHFEEDFEYRANFNKACYASMINVGLDKINAIFPAKQPDMNSLKTSISDLPLSIRTYNCLNRAGIATLKDIVMLTFDELLEVKNLGRRSADEVLAMVRSYGYDICPEDIDPQYWIEHYHRDYAAKEGKKEENEHIKKFEELFDKKETKVDEDGTTGDMQ